MTILSPTEYSALCNILEWAWSTLHNEPELCLKDVDYSSTTRKVKYERTEEDPEKGVGPGIHIEYEPTGIDPIKTGDCGLGLAEALEYTLENPKDQTQVMDMISTLMYKLNANTILACGQGNTWETLSPLVDKEELDRLEDLDDSGLKPLQTLEKYKVEDVGAKNKIAALQEHMNVDQNGFVDIGDGIFLDAKNSDLGAFE